MFHSHQQCPRVPVCPQPHLTVEFVLKDLSLRNVDNSWPKLSGDTPEGLDSRRLVMDVSFWGYPSAHDIPLAGL